MKTFTMNMILAAAAILGASAAQAETFLRAEVPFPFTMNGRSFRPGLYQVRTESKPAAQLVLYGLDNYRMGFALYQSEDLPREARSNNQPRLVFECLNGACTLVDVWDSNNGVDLRIPIRKSRKGNRAGTEETVTIP